MKRAIAIGVTVAICGALVLLFMRERGKRGEEKDKKRLADEIATLALTARPAAAKPSGEPDHVTGRVLPIELDVYDHDAPNGRAVVARNVLGALAPALQTDLLASAGTIVFIDTQSDLYMGDGAVATGPAGAVLTFYEGARPVARKVLEFPRRAKEEVTRQQLDDDRDRMAQVVATYVNGLPRR